jgi:hypothetical protein
LVARWRKGVAKLTQVPVPASRRIDPRKYVTVNLGVAAKLEKVFGEFLVGVLKSARADGIFEALPKAERCEPGVEESGGGFGWPVYKDRGKENLA